MTNTQTSSKVSIIMPAYNRAGLILETINSVRNQTYSNWELIIMDDGSDDNTEELITQLNDKRIQFYKGERTGMVSKLKNKGMQKASGELIAFIDSDDLWEKTKLDKQIIALQQYPEAGFSLTGGYNFKSPGEPLEYFYKQNEGTRFDDIFISIFKSEVAATTPSLILRKQCLQTMGAFRESKPFSDPEFIMDLARHFKAVILYEPLFFRRIHDTNDSDSNWVKRHFEGIEMIRSYQKFLPRKIVADFLFRSYIHYGEKCLVLKKRKSAIRSFLHAWQHRPFTIIPFKKLAKTVVYYLKGK